MIEWPPPAVVALGRVLAVLGASTLLRRRMIREFETSAAFSAPTVVVLGVAYTAHAAWALRGIVRAPGTLPIPQRPARVLGGALGAAGLGLVLAGFARFQSIAQLWGAERGALVTGGPYRFSRNPQYTGYVLLWAGAGGMRRSWHGLAAAVWYALAVRSWVPIEEDHLADEFGDEYRQWAAGRRRWL